MSAYVYLISDLYLAVRANQLANLQSQTTQLSPGDLQTPQMFLEANRTHHNGPTDPGQGLCKATSLVSPVQSLILLGALNTELQDLEVDLAVQKADQLAQNQGLEVQSLGHRVPNQDLKLQNPVHKVPSRDLRVQSPIPKVLR